MLELLEKDGVERGRGRVGGGRELTTCLNLQGKELRSRVGRGGAWRRELYSSGQCSGIVIQDPAERRRCDEGHPAASLGPRREAGTARTAVTASQLLKTT